MAMITSDSNTTTLAELIGGSVSENEPVQAEAHSREVLRRQPNDVGALAILGYALHAQGRFNEAEDVFAKLTLLDPAESIHWMNLGTARRCSGNPDDALHAFANAAALGAASADFYYNLALAHLDRNDFESA